MQGRGNLPLRFGRKGAEGRRAEAEAVRRAFRVIMDAASCCLGVIEFGG